MIEILKNNILYALIIGLVVPVGVSASAQQAMDNVVVSAGSRVLVTVLSPTSNVTTIQDQNMACGYSVTSTPTLVQDESVVNLHQGSSCIIQLSVAVLTSKQHLAVSNYSDARSVAVKKNTATVTAPKVARHPQPTKDAIITSQPTLAKLAVSETVVAHIVNTTQCGNSLGVVLTPTLQQFQIMRC